MVEMIDSTADQLSNMEMDRSNSTSNFAKTSTMTEEEDQAAAGAAPAGNPFTAQLLVGESGRVYACKVPDSFSFGRRGRRGGPAQSADTRGGRGRGSQRGRGGRGRGRGQGRGQPHHPPDTTTNDNNDV
jgi:hypothetical protein